MGDNIHVMLVF